MIPWDRINDLSRRSSELKEKGDFKAMLPLRQEIVRLLGENGADAKRVASGWNYIAYVNLQIGDPVAGEQAARRALSIYLEHFVSKDESLATHLWMISMTLEKQGRFTEALPYAEESTSLFAELHGEDNFVACRREDLARIRAQLWKG